MAIIVQGIVGNNGNPKRNEGVTTGNEFIYKVDPAKLVQATGKATSTGDATLYYSNDKYITPTDFSLMIKSSLGALTDNLGEELKGAEWVGVEVTSGTWTVNIKEL